MGLKVPEPGLRRLFYDSKSVAKVELRVQPGDALVVSEDVAGQLQAADGHFKDAEPPKAAPVVEDEAPETAKPAAKKAAARKG